MDREPYTDVISTAKDCPFCGSRPYIFATAHSISNTFQIGCRNKSCFLHSLIYASFDSPEKIIYEWNKRKENK